MMGAGAGGLVAIFMHPLGCLLLLLIILILIGIPLLLVSIWVFTHMIETLLVVGLVIGIRLIITSLKKEVT
jgi:hypothetical protein